MTALTPPAEITLDTTALSRVLADEFAREYGASRAARVPVTGDDAWISSESLGETLVRLIDFTTQRECLGIPADLDVIAYPAADGSVIIAVREADGYATPFGTPRQVSSFLLGARDVAVTRDTAGPHGHVQVARAVTEIANALAASLRALQAAGA